ncbi:MAG: hypothetical protein K8T89_25700 [Planctomycetes bacterium]|nr:hypothetical protein [Planctomycetota bacterium]
MRKLFSKMWNDDAGIVAFEYLLVATLIGLALVVGLATVSAALNAELVELANAILQLNQSYAVNSASVCSIASHGGGGATDTSTLAQYTHAAGVPVNIDQAVCP